MGVGVLKTKDSAIMEPTKQKTHVPSFLCGVFLAFVCALVAFLVTLLAWSMIAMAISFGCP